MPLAANDPLRLELRALGCSDGYCAIAGKATGQHTNGGCHCLNSPFTLEKKSKITRALMLLRRAANLE